MPVNMTLSVAAQSGGRIVESNKTYSGEAGPPLDVSIPDSSSDMFIAWNIDVSQIQAIIILSDYEITIKTNSSSTPDDTLVLPAGEPYLWTPDSLDTCLLTTDVTTGLYVSNSSGSAARLQIEDVTDATP